MSHHHTVDLNIALSQLFVTTYHHELAHRPAAAGDGPVAPTTVIVLTPLHPSRMIPVSVGAGTLPPLPNVTVAAAEPVSVSVLAVAAALIVSPIAHATRTRS